MKKVYHSPSIKVGEIVSNIMSGSGAGDQVINVNSNTGVVSGGGGDGTPTGGGMPRARANSAVDWDF